MKEAGNRKKRKRRIGDILRVIVLFIALSVLLYPTVSNYLYEKNSSRVITSYDEESVKLRDKERQQMLAEARAYNQEMLSNLELIDPFSPEKKEVNERYESLLNVNGSGMMGYIRIPKIEVELPIYHGTHETVLQSGVGHFEGTSLPVGGESTHTVLTGHRGLWSKKLFIDVDKLVEGDVFYIKILGENYAYEVDQILTVLPEETGELTIVPGKDYATLVSCTPYGINTHRLLIRGHRVPYEEAVDKVADQVAEPELPFYVKALIIGALIVIVILVIAVIFSKIHNGGKKKRGRTKNVQK